LFPRLPPLLGAAPMGSEYRRGSRSFVGRVRCCAP